MSAAKTQADAPLLCFDTLNRVNDTVHVPAYTPQQHGTGIVHLGPGAFHRAHQAVYTDAALSISGGDWRIVSISLRSRDVADALNHQDGLYTLIENSTGGSRARIIGCLERVIAAADDREAALLAMADPSTRIISMTVTEKAYGIDRLAPGLDENHPAVAHDLAHPRQPEGVLGLIVESLRRRWQAGHNAPTLLCCDNLPNNGDVLRAGVLDFARRIDPALAGWIKKEACFPSSMVDRITPASTEETLNRCHDLTGCIDKVPVETEAFTQWVIEDSFADGRPDWGAAGVLFVPSVAPFEHMKLRMLNGAHSMLAYSGFLSGCTHVRDVMADPHLSRLVQRHLAAAASTLKPLKGIDYGQYAEQLIQRFKNPAMAHETYQIAMDGTEKLPQRLIAPAVEAVELQQDCRPYAFAVAAWMRYCMGRTDEGATFHLRDPKEAMIRELLDGQSTAADIEAALTPIPGLFPDALLDHAQWRAQVVEILTSFLQNGARATTAVEAGRR